MRIRPRWFALQRAVYHLIEHGKAVTQAALAELMGVRRQTVWCFFQDNPGFLTWLDEQLKAENEHLLSPLVRRHFHIGMQGSVPSAEFVARVLGGHYTRELAPGQTAINNGFVINNLIHRPEPVAMPTEDGRLRLPPPDSVPVVDVAVPVVNVRGPR